MLGKLLKYELKATSRVLLPLYGLYLGIALLTNLFFSIGADIASAISTFAFVGIAVACLVMTFIILIQRFTVNLLQDEGYLMFTLPVSTTKIILSKLFVALFWGIISGIIAVIGGFFLFIDGEFLSLFSEIPELIAALRDNMRWEYVVLLLEFFAASIVSFCGFVMAVYASLSTGQLPFTGKHKKLAGVITFFVIYILYAILASFIGDFAFGDTLLNVDVTAMLLPMALSLLLEFAFFLCLFFYTRYILKNKLNLE